MTQLVITSDPASTDAAKNEMRALMPKARFKKLGNGALLVQTRGRFGAIAERWRQDPPIFVRHINPVDELVVLTGEDADIARMIKVARTELAEALVTGRPFGVQSRVHIPKMPYKPFNINQLLSEALANESGAVVEPRNPEQVVSVVVSLLDDTPVGLLGISLTSHNLSAWPGGAQRFRREEDQVSRAEFKLLEAFSAFDLQPPAKGTALDLGAAPGGWTRVMRRYGWRVVAVDPAALHPSLLEDDMVTHLRMHTQTFLRDNTRRFDLILNDMRLDPTRSADLLLDCASALGDNGHAIMTLKLPKHDPEKLVRNTLRQLGRRYIIANARQLFHNRNEITILLRHK